MKTVFFKRGEKLQFNIVLKDDEDNLLDINIEDLSSQIRDSYNNLISEFTISEGTGSGKYILTCEDTTDFPLSDVYFDIAIEMDDGTLCYSPTYTLTVQEEITRK